MSKCISQLHAVRLVPPHLAPAVLQDRSTVQDPRQDPRQVPTTVVQAVQAPTTAVQDPVTVQGVPTTVQEVPTTILTGMCIL